MTSPATLPQWRRVIGWVDKSQQRDHCEHKDDATGKTHTATGDRVCNGTPARYRLRFSATGRASVEFMLCSNCAARAAHRYQHPFPPGQWTDDQTTKPA